MKMKQKILAGLVLISTTGLMAAQVVEVWSINSRLYGVRCSDGRTGTVELTSLGNLCATGADPTCRPRSEWSVDAAAKHVCK